jgi:hypothetical protein
MYGRHLPVGDEGYLNDGLGPDSRFGQISYIPPNQTFADTLDVTIAGVKLHLVYVPSETTDEIAIYLPDQAGEFDRPELKRRLIPLQARLGRLLRRGQESPNRKAAGLCRELSKWWPALWTFARMEGVEPTNNVAERALRPAVLWRKGSFGSDSELGHHFAERLLSVESRCRWLAQV